MRRRVIGDVSGLPDFGFGSRSLMWWGTLGFILIEGTAFVLACASYLFLSGQTEPWPPNRAPPALAYGAIFTVLLLASEAPNIWVEKKAHEMKPRPTRLGLVVMSAVGVVLLVVRGFEFTALNTRWDDTAYGSIVWALMLLHTVHIATDLADTIFLTLFTFTHPIDGGRFSDVTDNSMYWRFVVISWLPLYALVYWAPRLT